MLLRYRLGLLQRFAQSLVLRFALLLLGDGAVVESAASVLRFGRRDARSQPEVAAVLRSRAKYTVVARATAGRYLPGATT